MLLIQYHWTIKDLHTGASASRFPVSMCSSQMDDDAPEWGVVVACVTLLLAIHCVLLYTTWRIFSHRHTLHIAQVSKMMIASGFAGVPCICV
jgi:hypothetical protein